MERNGKPKLATRKRLFTKPRARGGTLIVIGGHEDRNGEKAILAEVAKKISSGKLVITTVASSEPNGLYQDYEKAFRSLGVKHVRHLLVESRAEARKDSCLRILDDADGVFFTGGDQLRITSQIGDTPIFTRVREIYRNGGVVAGTSAGASVVCETMLISGKSDRSHRIQDSLQMAPGLGLVSGIIIDQHFAERGRMGRLLGAIAQNPANIGIGIDEDSAIMIEEDQFSVLGSGAVYVLDGRFVTKSNIFEGSQDQVLSIYDVKLHVLSYGDSFVLSERRPEGVEEPETN